MTPPKDDILSERNRAEDIILGGLGFGEDASITTVELLESGYFKGSGHFDDGESFEFESDDEATELELWAIDILEGALPQEQLAK